MLAAPGAYSEVIAASEVLILKHAVTLLAKEEVTLFDGARRVAEGQMKIETLGLVISAAEANAGYRSVVERHVAALDAKMPIRLLRHGLFLFQ
jgi:hypothetical protein